MQREEPSLCTNREGDEDCIELENYHYGQDEDDEPNSDSDEDKQPGVALTPKKKQPGIHSTKQLL